MKDELAKLAAQDDASKAQLLSMGLPAALDALANGAGSAMPADLSQMISEVRR